MMSQDGVAGMPPSFNYTPENMQSLQRVSMPQIFSVLYMQQLKDGNGSLKIGWYLFSMFPKFLLDGLDRISEDIAHSMR